MAHDNQAMKRNITRGVRAELLAAEWLIEQGIWSFIPMSAQGPIDLVGVDKDGVVHLFDILLMPNPGIAPGYSLLVRAVPTVAFTSHTL